MNSRKPICIDSKVVERIDKIENSTIKSIYRCALKKKVPFNEYFALSTPDLGVRLKKIERVLEEIEPFKQRVKFFVSDSDPFEFYIEDHQVTIGKDLLRSSGHVEKALAKIWYRERISNFYKDEILFEEVLTDFLIYIARGELDLADPVSKNITEIIKAPLPLSSSLTLKNLVNYCDSAWRKSEDISNCQAMIPFEDPSLGVRSWLSSKWIATYKRLSSRDRFFFVAEIPNILRSARIEEYINFENENTISQEPPESLAKFKNEHASLNNQTSLNTSSESLLTLISAKLNKFNFWVHSFSVINKTKPVIEFDDYWVADNLELGGSEFLAKASFDFLIQVPAKISHSSGLISDINEFSQKHPEVQIAIRDPESLWIAMTRSPVSLGVIGTVKATKTIIEKCGDYKFASALSLADKTEKLLVVNNCDKSRSLKYEKYFIEGAEGFAAQNKGVSFVQFHLPSLMMRRSFMQASDNIFDFLMRRDSAVSLSTNLGWQDVQWNRIAKAYQPKAYVDAIEWFRVPEKDRTYRN